MEEFSLVKGQHTDAVTKTPLVVFSANLRRKMKSDVSHCNRRSEN